MPMEAKDQTPSNSRVDQLIDTLWGSAKSQGCENCVYAILDGAKNPKLYAMINNSGLESSCLFAGQLSFKMMRAAPHLVKLDQSNSFTRDIIAQGWGKHWGIFLIAEPNATINSIRNHCRRISRVMSPNGKPLYFRYYDPSIITEVLPACSDEEIQILFGPISYIVTESTDAQNWTVAYRAEENTQLKLHSIQNASEVQKSVRYTPFAYRNHFQLRQAHLNVFEKKADLDFFKEIYPRYLNCYKDNPQKLFQIGDQKFKLPAFLWQCYQKGADYELKNAYSFIVFFHLASEFGWGFWDKEQYNWVNDILEQDRPAEIRIANIEKQLSARLMERMWS